MTNQRTAKKSLGQRVLLLLQECFDLFSLINSIDPPQGIYLHLLEEIFPLVIDLQRLEHPFLEMIVIKAAEQEAGGCLTVSPFIPQASR